MADSVDDTDVAADTASPDAVDVDDTAAPVEWTTGSSGTNEDLNAVAWGDSGFVAVGRNGVIRVSETGQAWQTVLSPTGHALRGVIWDGVQYVAVGDAGTVLTSTLGDQWLVRDAAATATSAALSGVAYADGTYVAVGDGGTILRSTTQAVGWQEQTSGTSAALLAVTRGPARFVAVGAAGTALSSADGAAWEAADPGTDYDLAAVAYWTGFFVAGGNIGLYTSPDGAAPWTQRTVDGAVGVVVTGFGGGPYQLLAVTHTGDVLASPNGLDWSFEGDRLTSAVLHGVAYGGGRWVVVGQAGALFTSP
ncbi:MAG: hypothetical protein CVU56_06165 [Deltaproteobacteria bacterium HGW-Deltaproteobacteria-14]|nr:MAG: hypothetical protein CVU56_06165 [Deltaproteobacteria bacterium HGW-Deltaproteobacteria-14]